MFETTSWDIFDDLEGWSGSCKEKGYGRTYSLEDPYWNVYFNLTAAHVAYILRNCLNPLFIDIGGGAGFQAIVFSMWGIKSPLVIEPSSYCSSTYASKVRSIYHPIRFNRAYLPFLPLASDCADAIFCADVLEHIEERLLRSSIGEIRRVLRPEGGIAIIAIPTLLEEKIMGIDTEASRKKGHVTMKTREWFLDLFMASGLEPAKEDFMTKVIRFVGSRYLFGKIFCSTARDGIFILRRTL